MFIDFKEGEVVQEVIVIVGPTGVGKTKLSIELALRMNAEIINGDSVSVYKGLDIGSAKPTIEERGGVVHHLIDICEIGDFYSVFDYQRDVRRLISDITKRGKRVIIVGGTGFYIKAALYDYNFSEGTTYNEYSELSNIEIFKRIKNFDSDISIDVNNRKRLVRFLNKIENGEEISNNKNVLLYPCRVIGLTTDREILYLRINERVDLMIKNGLLDEVSNFKDKYMDSRILNSAIGYREFYDYFYNNASLEEVVEAIRLHSRRYAKRQYTFFKHQFDVKWVNVNYDDFSKTIDEVYDFIKKEA